VEFDISSRVDEQYTCFDCLVGDEPDPVVVGDLVILNLDLLANMG